MAMALDSALLTTRAAAEAFVGGVCFKLGPPTLIGAELEWLTARSDGDCTRPELKTLASALGDYAPTSIAPSSSARPLPRGSYVTVEPGGQIEISSAPSDSAEQLCRWLSDDARFLRDLLASQSIHTIAAAADADRSPQRLLTLPRYCAMAERFAHIGPYGALMMCNTTATQVSVDAGRDVAEVAARWTALDAIGPALIAAFACSPDMAGAPEGTWASQRMRSWLHLDRARTSAPPSGTADPIAAYARWALDVPLMCVVRGPEENWAAPPDATFADWLGGALDDELGRRPDHRDLAYHLTTLFPPVRANGHLEVRYIDAQPGRSWSVPILAIDALLSRPDVIAEATAVAAGTAQRWWEAAEHGLGDPELRTAAEDLLLLAAASSTSTGGTEQLDAAADRCRRGRTPAEEDR
ncbi:ergothioneine biosynthesis glutamate--cysteine ligase EgtA [Antrihabitans cavernicola]|uniref:Glutamate--cysteine ligase EgtA n=1 Tax=Antrihabitans cavernicola TaxID=2495913 RepID=A0A5A7SFA4_9NOCA|nr:ergothioneine biosynthesis glutamate--cysteine ligase EgtA [Spelaeibacter cavernicola]KAA0023842.1 ergothioneine biosynthesis glutamate--cysteine ligase EgtA [Spelaeibacter cavernicola]